MEIQKAAQYRSFYETAKKIKDPESRLAFYDALDAYRFEGIEPDNLPFAADLAFTAIKPFIDADVNRKNGGAPKGNSNAKKQPENGDKIGDKIGDNKPQNNGENNPENNLETTTKQRVVFEKTNNEDVEEEEDVEEKGEGEEKENLVLANNPALRRYAVSIFEILKNADLPCCNGNDISFLHRDFKFALETLHKRAETQGIHSNAVIQALKNYIAVYKDPKCYLKQAYSFDRFVGLKNFCDFLPDRFRHENFIAYGKMANAREPPAESISDKMQRWKAEGGENGGAA